MVESFVYEASAARVVFGSGSLRQVEDEAARLGIERALVLCTRGQRPAASAVASILGPRAAGIFDGAVMHTPVAVTERALIEGKSLNVDGVVAVGGGSTIGLGKALALRMDWPQLVIPTTYAGSEMTPILGESEHGRKTTQRSARVLPETIIYDVDLTLSLPSEMSAASGMNAIAHAVEATYAQNSNPVVTLMACEGIGVLTRALPTIAREPRDLRARTSALYGAWLCGYCLRTAGMGLHHKLCHTLGGMFDLPHAEAHAILLPYTIAYNAPACLESMRRIADSLDGKDPARAIYELTLALPLPRALRDIGMPEHGIERAADAAVESPYWNPRPVERAAIGDLIARAWSGSPPGFR